MNVQLETKKGFGNIVDICSSIMFLQIVYSALLAFYYVGYQSGKTGFQPLLYLSIVILQIIVFISEKYTIEMWKLSLVEIISALMLIFAVPIQSKTMFAGGCIIICIRSIYKHHFRYSGSASYSERYVSSKRDIIKLVIISALFIIHKVTAVKNNEVTIILPQICSYYMLFSLAVFIISMLMKKYAFKFYEYFRQEVSDEKDSRQLKHSMILILSAIIILVSTTFVVFGNLFVPVIKFIGNIILKIVCSLMLSLFNIDLTADVSNIKRQVEVDSSGGDFISRARHDSPISSLVPMIIVTIIIIAVLYIIWKIYKAFLANYHVGSDEAEFIEVKKEKTEYENTKITKTPVIFGKSNRDKVRKYYYKSVTKKQRKYNIEHHNYNTPKEINKSIPYNPSEKQSMEKMTEIYEKARYSDENIDEKDVLRMKELSDNV